MAALGGWCLCQGLVVTVKSVLYGVGAVLAVVLGYRLFYALPEAPPAQPVQAEPIQVAQEPLVPEKQRESVSLAQAAAADSRRVDKSTGESLISDLAWQGWSVEDFYECARADKDFAARLRQSIGLCSIISGGSNPRFNDPRWRTYHRQCADRPWMQLREGMHDADRMPLPDLHPDIEAAIALPEGDPEARRLATGVLTSSTDRAELQHAYALYFDAHRTRAMAGTDMHSGLGLDRMEQISLQTEASLYVSCRFAAQGCAWNDPGVLVECATTKGCFPGMSMEQIIALRRSPLEMELLRLVAEEVAQLRRGP